MYFKVNWRLASHLYLTKINKKFKIIKNNKNNKICKYNLIYLLIVSFYKILNCRIIIIVQRISKLSINKMIKKKL